MNSSKTIGWKFVGEQDILHSFKVFSHRLLAHYKGHKSTLPVHKLCGQHCNQGLKLTSPNITNNDRLNQAPPDTRHWEGHSIAWVKTLLNMYYLNPTVRTHQNKLKLKDILQRLIHNILKNVNVMKEKEKLRNCSRLKVTKEGVLLPWWSSG